MHRILIVTAALLLVLTSIASSRVTRSIHPQAAKAAPRPAPSRTDGWPDTRAGAVARRWVEAFSAGEKAMRAALPDLLAPGAFDRHSMEERIETYRASHERLGTLMLVKILKSAPGEITASLASSDLTERPFTFKVQTEPPYRLISVTALDRVPGHGFFNH